MKTVYAIAIGVINPKIGDTKYKWNVYDDAATIFVCGDRWLIGCANSLNLGDQVVVKNNDSQRKLQVLTVNSICSSKEEVIKYLESVGYNMKTPKPFQKFVGRKYEPSTSYSIKGVE